MHEGFNLGKDSQIDPKTAEGFWKNVTDKIEDKDDTGEIE